MLPLMVNVQPANLGAPNQATNTPQVVPTTTLSDASAAARQQLPVAVAASGAALGFSPNTPQQPKPAIRNVEIRSAGSSVAAQVIAQTTGLTEEELQVFVAPPPNKEPTYKSEDQDYLEDMRAARGESAAVKPAAASVVKTPAAAEAPPLAIATHNALPVAQQTIVASNQPIKMFVSLLAPVGKKPNLTNAPRGEGSYRVAAMRNNAISFPPTITAVM